MSPLASSTAFSAESRLPEQPARVPREGLEPSCLSATDFESAASANSATGATVSVEAKAVY